MIEGHPLSTLTWHRQYMFLLSRDRASEGCSHKTILDASILFKENQTGPRPVPSPDFSSLSILPHRNVSSIPIQFVPEVMQAHLYMSKTTTTK